jgi:hypothetical protein
MPASIAFGDISRRASPPLRRWLAKRRAAVIRVLDGVVVAARPSARPLTAAEANEQTARRWIARTAALQSALRSATSLRDLRLPAGFESEEHRYGRSQSVAVYGPVESDLPRVGGVATQFYWAGDTFPSPASALRSLVERVDLLARFDTPKTVLAERRKGTLSDAWTLPLRPE